MMDFIKKNLGLVIASGVAILLLLVAAAFLFWQIATFHRASIALGKEQGRLQQLHEQDPYPSDANVLLVRSNLTLLNRYQQQLADQLRQGQIEPLAIQPVDFNHLLQTTIPKMLAQAEQLKITLPPKFAFGFESYYREGQLPIIADVPRLTVQLQTVEALFNLVCQMKVSEIVSLERQTFEERAVSDADAAAGGGRARGAAPVGATDIKEKNPVAPPEAGGLYTREHITLTLQARDEAILALLNAFASSGTTAGTGKPKFFAVVSKLSLATTAGGGTRVATEALIRTKPPETPESKDQLTEDTRSHEERIVAGREMVQLTLELDVYRFSPNPHGKAKP